MTGLMMKDLLVMRKALKSYFLIIAFYAVLAWMDILNFGFSITFIQVMLMVLPISAFAYDDQSKWDRYAMSLPLGRSKVVGARYLFVLLLSLCTLALGLGGAAFSCMFQQEDLLEVLLTLIVSTAIGLLIPALLLPVTYKWGPERARIYLYAMFLIPFVGVLLLAKANLIDFSALNRLETLPPTVLIGGMALLPLGALAALFVSYFISCRVVAGKEY